MSVFHKPRLLRSAVALAATVCSVAVLAPAALAAAPPANDTVAAATTVTKGFSQVLDTTGATTDADDTQLNASCGAPATDASVWYTIQGDGTSVLIDTLASNYSTGITVATGTLGNLQTLVCGPGAVVFSADPGATYYLQVFDYQGDGGGNGGILNLTVSEAPPAPTVEVTVNPKGAFDAKTGAARISGTYTCSNGDFVDVFVDARQRVGRGFVTGFGAFFDVGTCDGSPRAWTADVFPNGGKFAGGKALSVSFAVSCGLIQCGTGFTEQTVQLSGGKK
jgi:hypothetical protein